jgi:four helix bundle protein
MNVFEKVVTYGNPIVTKSFAFAIRIVKFYKIYMDKDRKLEPVYKQLLRSGTSVGANISEAQSAFTKKDFIHKMGIPLKESRETEYWLKLLKESGSITVDEFNSLIYDCEKISKLLTSIIKSAKSK